VPPTAAEPDLPASVATEEEENILEDEDPSLLVAVQEGDDVFGEENPLSHPCDLGEVP